MREGFEKTGGLPDRGVLEPLVPFLEQKAKIVAQLREFGETGLGRGELGRGNGPHLPAGAAALVPFTEDHREFAQGKAEGQGASDEKHPSERRLRIDPVVVRGTFGPGQHTHAFVVPQGVGTDPRPPRQFSGRDRHVGTLWSLESIPGSSRIFRKGA